ncbi:hypothetical protein [Streptacidiphilus cavernicola]|uniref:ANTAR domain-containing protein n=1 Tax=Streptacidiphilus cavernicola TaxID=3342716 RepID=A0ABV6VP18_9ACTN
MKDLNQRELPVVHQAAGLVTLQARVRTERAYELMHGHALAYGLRMCEVARQVLLRQLRFTSGA